MRASFEGQLRELSKEMTTMGAQCEEAIAKATQAFLTGDMELAKSVMELSAAIDRREADIEAMCLKLLMQQQPVASDLRIISAALKMVTDMERIGDQSADIAEILLTARLPKEERNRLYREMSLDVIKMVNDSLDAFLREDLDLARAVIAYDDVVDGHFVSMKEELIRELRGPESPGEHVVDLLMIAKYLERIGDHAVNIAKWVVFSVTGELDG